jgi:hypothetical protein
MKRLTSGVMSILVTCTVATIAHADDGPPRSGYYVTGEAKLEPSTGSKYLVSHEMKSLPEGKVPASARQPDITKRFVFTFVADTTCDEIKEVFRAGLVRNGAGTSVATSFTSQVGLACGSGTVKKHQQMMLSYSADTKASTLWVDGKGTTTIQGTESMRTLWGIWLGLPPVANVDTDLVSRL